MVAALRAIFPPRGERARFLREIWPGLTVLLTVVALGLVWRIHMTPTGLYVDRGVDGPLAWAVQVGPEVRSGPSLPAVPRGGTFSIVSDFTPARGVAYRAYITLLRPDGSEAWAIRRPYAPDERRPGPQPATFRIPDRTPSGQLEPLGRWCLTRTAAFLRGETEVRVDLQGLCFQVIAAGGGEP